MEKKYQIIYADPPWSYNDKMSGHSFSLDHEYETQSKQWISNLPVREIACDTCCLFLWVTSPLLDDEVCRVYILLSLLLRCLLFSISTPMYIQSLGLLENRAPVEESGNGFL